MSRIDVKRSLRARKGRYSWASEEEERSARSAPRAASSQLRLTGNGVIITAVIAIRPARRNSTFRSSYVYLADPSRGARNVRRGFRYRRNDLPGVMPLDFVGPHAIFCRIPGTTTIVASEQGGAIAAEDGLVFDRTRRMADIERCDLLFVPGGLAATEIINDAAFMREFMRLARHARYHTSVCTGSLVLGAAGLLRGKRAASHWAWRHMLPLFGAIPDESRVARDGNIFTGGGVTAGIDFALVVAAEIGGERLAQELQLDLEYAPAPPFNAGRPESAPSDVLATIKERGSRHMPAHLEAVKAAARSLGIP